MKHERALKILPWLLVLCVFAMAYIPALTDFNSNQFGTANNQVTIKSGSLITNAVLTTPSIASFASAQHNHQNAAGGGTLDAAAIAAGTLSVARGGTGQGTATAAFNALDPLTTKGDLLVHDGTDSVRFPAGANYELLQYDSGATDGVKTTLIGDNNVDSSAAIQRSKLAAGTADHIVINAGDGTFSSEATIGDARMPAVGTAGTYRSVTTDAKGRVSAGSNPTTFAGYGLSDTSANLRSALTDESGTGADVFQNGALGDATASSLDVTNSLKLQNATASRVLVTDGNKFATNSTVTTTTLGYLDATSSIQTQLDARVLKAGDTMTGTLTVTGLTNSALTASRAVVSASDKSLASSATTSTELGYVNGVTSAIQTQLDGKTSTSYGRVELWPALMPKINFANSGRIDMSENSDKILFDPTTDQTVIFQFILPQNYSASPTLVIYYSMASATANSVRWEALVMATTPGDAADENTDSYDSTNSNGGTVPGTAGYMDTITITLTNNDSWAAGDRVRLKFRRDADGTTGTDNATGDAELLGLELRYTAR